MTEKKKKRFAVGALFLATLIWGSGFCVLKDSLDHVPKCYTLAFEFTVAVILIAVVFWKRLKKIDRRILMQGILIGLVLAAAEYFQTFGLEGTSPGKNAFLTTTYCVMVPFLFWLAAGKKPNRHNLTAAFLCLIGIGLVTWTGGAAMNLGDLMTLVCSFFFALQIVFIAKYAPETDPVLLTILQFAVNAVVFWILAFVTETRPEGLTMHEVWPLLYLAVVVTALAMFLQNVGQKYTGASTASLILSLESVFGVVFSILFYGERLTVRVAIGFVVIFIAVIIAQKEEAGKEEKNDEKMEEI